jgi:hypothetical protein
MNAATKEEGAALAAVTTGLYPGISIEDYHAGAGISKSGLDSLDANAAIYYARHLDPNRPPAPSRAGQLEGSLTHCAVLEPDQFSARYIVGPNVSRATKEWKAFEAANPGKSCIKPDQYDVAMRQADSIRKLPEVAEALGRGVAEVSAYWIDPATKELCRCRPDWAHDCGTSQTILLDVKTCGDASPAEFRRQIARKRYHVQDAFYTDGYSAASGREVLAFVFVAVEDEWPFAACALMLDDEGKDQGRRDYRRNLNTYAECRKSGVWPGYSSQIEIVTLPAWALTGEQA